MKSLTKAVSCAVALCGLVGCALIDNASTTWHDISPPQLGQTGTVSIVKTVSGIDIYTSDSLPTKPWLLYGYISAGGTVSGIQSSAIRLAKSKDAELLVLMPKMIKNPSGIVGMGYGVGMYIPIPP